MVDARRKTYKINGVEKLADSKGILWLTESHIKFSDDYGKVSFKTQKTQI